MITISLNKIIMILCMIFPTTTLLQGQRSFDAINRVVTGFILVMILFSFFKKNMSPRTFILLVLSAISAAFSAYYTENMFRINDMLYFVLWMVFLIYLMDNYDGLIRLISENLGLVHFFVALWSFLVAVSMAFPTSYDSVSGSVYFFSFAGAQHRFASTCLFAAALALILALQKGKKRYLLYLILPFASVLMCGARTFLGVMFIYFVCIYYLYCPSARVFWLTILPLAALSTVLAFATPIGDKLLSTMDVTGSVWTDDTIANFTNGRSNFLAVDLEYFFNMPTWKQLVGDGVTTVYYINSAAGHGFIWAHNDIVNLLLSNGYLGVVLYLAVYFYFTAYSVKGRRMSPVLIGGIIMIWFFNAMFNMVYTYTCCVLALPFIHYSLSIKTPVLDIKKKGEIHNVYGYRISCKNH